MSVFARPRLLVLGGTGLLGSKLCLPRDETCFSWVMHGRSSGGDVRADLQDKAQTKAMLSDLRPDGIVNLVALTDVDRCESHPTEAFLTNVRTLENVVSCAREVGIAPKIMHISTDQVYDGLGPHYESQAKPANYYAFSKYMSEMIAIAAQGVVLRTNFFGKSLCASRDSFTDWIFRSSVNEAKISVFNDVWFSPISMQKLASCIEIVYDLDLCGIYNLGSRNGMTKAEFSYAFCEAVGLPTKNMSSLPIAKASSLACYRPKDMRMRTEAVEVMLGEQMPSLQDEIIEVAKDYI